MKYFPIFLDVQEKNIVVAGGGEAAICKLRIILKTTAKVSVYASKVDPEILSWAKEGKLTLNKRKIEFEDLKNADILYSTYHSHELNKKIAALGRSAGVLTNIVDRPALSDFISPAIVDRDPVVVAIGTEGAAPVLGRKIKTHLEAHLPPSLGIMAKIAKGFRSKVEILPFGRARREFWSRYYDNEFTKETEALNALTLQLENAQGQAPKIGKVSFVSAGPGDPELMTLKARKRLDKADIVIHDQLVTPEILELARREAKLINVGKKGYGVSWKQEDINALMVEHTQKGESVVRLKGGDASIFGRLDEEIEALRVADLDFEVIPGVTAASSAAASLGQSLTRRERNSELRILSARDLIGFVEHQWRELAQKDTIAGIYMGKKAAHFLQGRLLMHGAHPLTPITAVENASRSNERVVSTNIAQLAQDLESSSLIGPTLLLLGIAPHNQTREEETYAARV